MHIRRPKGTSQVLLFIPARVNFFPILQHVVYCFLFRSVVAVVGGLVKTGLLPAEAEAAVV